MIDIVVQTVGLVRRVESGVVTATIVNGIDLPAHPPWDKTRGASGASATKDEPVINLKTARALGLEVPPRLLARADSAFDAFCPQRQ